MRLLGAIFFILLSFSYGFCENSIVLSASIEKKNNGYYISSSISISGFDTSSFNEEKINLLNDEMIIEGVFDGNIIKEKDFLFSERNIDLNGDGDFDDFFNIKLKGDRVSLDGKDVPVLLRRSGKNKLLVNMRSELMDKFVLAKGGSLVVYSCDDKNGLLVIASNRGNPIMQYNNSLMTVEIVAREGSNIPAIDGLAFKKVSTNERIFSGDGQWLVKYIAAFHIPLKNNSGNRIVFLKNMDSNFILRVRYYFAISSSVIIYAEKILYP